MVAQWINSRNTEADVQLAREGPLVAPNSVRIINPGPVGGGLQFLE